MASPWITTDLATVSLAEAGQSYVEFTGYALGDGAAVETDWFLQGAACASDEANGKTGVGHSIAVDYGSGITFSSGDCFFAWMQCQAGNAMDLFVNGGYRIIIGASVANYNAWFVGGRDFGRNPYGGWVNVVADPTYTPVDHTLGSPGIYQFFGVGFNLTSAIGKGRPVNADAMRWGRGQIIASEGTISTPCTFVNMGIKNDGQDYRWGLFQNQGASYLWKGLMTIGTATSAAYFEDSNRVINIDVTPRTYPDFNKIEIRNVSSTVIWNNINFTSLDQTGLSIGRFKVVDNVNLELNGCSFTDMDTFEFLSNSDVLNTTFRRINGIYQDDNIFNGCTFSNPASAVGLTADDIEKISNCAFESDGTGHAIELLPAHAGNTYTFTGNTFSLYASANGSTGNEAIYNNSGGAVTINIEGTTNVPSYRNGTSATTTINLTVSLTLTGIVSGSEVRIQEARGSAPSGAELYHVETTTGADVVWTYNYSGFSPTQKIDIIVHHVYYTYYRIDDLLLPASNTSIPIQQQADRWYTNPIITKTETFGKRPIDNWQTWQDSYMDSDNPTLNYSTEESLLTYLGVNNPIFSPKIGNGIIPSFSTINSAKIWVYIFTNDQTGSEATTVRLLRRNWVTSEVDWDEWSNGNAWTIGGGTDTTDDIYGSSGDLILIGAGQTGWISWTVTDDIQDWLDGIYPNLYGWVMLGGGIGGLGWEGRSSNYLANTSLRPYLSINWTQ